MGAAPIHGVCPIYHGVYLRGELVRRSVVARANSLWRVGVRLGECFTGVLLGFRVRRVYG